MHFKLEFLVEAGAVSLYARVHLDGEGRGITLSVCGEPGCVGAGQSRGAERVTRGVSGNGGDGIVVARGIGRGIVQIPNPAVHAGVCRQRAERTQPVERDELFLQFGFGDIGLVGAGEFAHELGR